ncbi:MAG TPA: D-alanyl-D-alanine carboxypeptidase family protein [Gaiellaceae bacterium]
MAVRVKVLVLAATAMALAPSAHAGPPPVAARAYFVENAATGEVLARKADGARLPMASLTKLMTVDVALRRLQPDQVVTVAAGAASVGESTVELVPGERLTVRDLLKAALIQSANDAADALAYGASAGNASAFVAQMNARARVLGLSDTHYERPDGLDATGHYSSARDVTRLAEIVMHQPIVRSIVRERTDTIAGGRVLHTWNDLLGSFPGLIGVKTGHTAAAGWCEVGAARGPGLTIYATVLGSPTRAQRNRDLAALLSWGLDRYRVVPVVQAHRVYARATVGWGRGPLALVADRQLMRSVRVDRPLVERVVAPLSVELPVQRGERLGSVKVYAGRRFLGERPLVAARSIRRPGWGGRFGWYARRTVHHLIGFLP